jgi:hypothetical protein
MSSGPGHIALLLLGSLGPFTAGAAAQFTTPPLPVPYLSSLYLKPRLHGER